jgi:GT2 family glycosyltransferase
MTEMLAVVPTYLTEPADLEVTLKMLESLRATEPDLAVVVVDDGSPATQLVDEIAAAKSRLEFALVRRPVNEGFARTVNVGLTMARDSDRDAILVNADIEFIDQNWAKRMQMTQRFDGQGPAAVVGGLLLYPTGLIQHAGVFFSLLHRCFDHRYKYAPLDLPEALVAESCPVTGALQFIRNDCLQIVGLYDEGFRLGWEDVDYCLRVFMAGGECVYEPTVRAFHYESMFRGRPSPKIQDWQAHSWLYLVQKYKTTSFALWVPGL